MPTNLSIKNVPDDVVRGLRNRAAANQRTLQQELLDILRQASKGQSEVTIDVLLERAQQAKPALDETASKVLAAQDAEHERIAQRFEDLLGQADSADRNPEPGR